MTIIFEPLFPGVLPPTAATADSAGLDAVAWLEGRSVRAIDKVGNAYEYGNGQVWIPSQGRALIPLGFKAKLPAGWECQVRPRSGLAYSVGVTVLNAPGTIDCDYPGEWAVLLHNTTIDIASIEHGQRVAQLVLAPVHRMDWRVGTVSASTDRVGGFGSTGA